MNDPFVAKGPYPPDRQTARNNVFYCRRKEDWMKNPGEHIKTTTRWMKLWDFLQKLKDRQQIRELWRLLPTIRYMIRVRTATRRFIYVQDYIVPCIRDTVERKAVSNHIRLHFSVGAVHDSVPPPPDVNQQQMRDIVVIKRLTGAQALEELMTQDLRPPRVTELIDFLLAHGETVTHEQPVYVVVRQERDERDPETFKRPTHHVLRASRDELGLSVEMPNDLPRRRVDKAILIPPGSRILGVSRRPIADVLEPRWSTSDGSPEPA
jgi:hypothetical protein